MRQVSVAMLVLALGPAVVLAQGGWANRLFVNGTEHDFQTVPHGAQLSHKFEVKNPYAVPLTIVNIQASCGCVTATPSFKSLAPRETGVVEIIMDARKFTGAKVVRVNITVGPDYTSTAELVIKAYSRADVVLNPSQVTFGVVAGGGAATQTIDVDYAGKFDWRAKDVVTNGAPVAAQLEEVFRRPDNKGNTLVRYQVKFTLQPNASGSFKQEVFLQTNDPASPMVPILVEANVQAPLTVSPDPLRLSDLKVGQEKVARVTVRGSRPFKIVGLDGADESVSLVTPVPTAASNQHTVMLKVRLGSPTELRRQVMIRTDLQDSPLPVTVEANPGQ